MTTESEHGFDLLITLDEFLSLPYVRVKHKYSRTRRGRIAQIGDVKQGDPTYIKHERIIGWAILDDDAYRYDKHSLFDRRILMLHESDIHRDIGKKPKGFVEDDGRDYEPET